MYYNGEEEILDYEEDIEINVDSERITETESDYENDADFLAIKASIKEMREENKRMSELKKKIEKEKCDEDFVNNKMDGAAKKCLLEADELFDRLKRLENMHETGVVLTETTDQNNKIETEYSLEKDPEFLSIQDNINITDKEIMKVDTLLDMYNKILEVTPNIVIDETLEDKISIDNRSVHVGNVDYGATKDMLKEIFCKCGKVQRVSIPLNRNSNIPMGFAYIQFELQSSVDEALKMDGVMLRSRSIRVMPKRTKQAVSTTNKRPPLVPIASRNMHVNGVGHVRTTKPMNNHYSRNDAYFRTGQTKNLVHNGRNFSSRYSYRRPTPY